MIPAVPLVWVHIPVTIPSDRQTECREAYKAAEGESSAFIQFCCVPLGGNVGYGLRAVSGRSDLLEKAMTATNFDASLAYTLGYEGGFSNNPADPGAATMAGITQQVYEEDRVRRRLALQSVKLSTTAERANIYRWRYWAEVQGDAMPSGVDYALFDFAVNSGVGRSVKSLQQIVGVQIDGNAGRYTCAAVQAYCSAYQASALTDALCHARMQFLHGLSTFATFGKGWTVRVMGQQDGTQAGDTGVIDRSFAMATDVTPMAPTNQVVTPKTYIATSLTNVTGSVV